MLGRDHVLIAFLIGVVISACFYMVTEIDLAFLLIFMFGIVSGSLIPDIDSPDSAMNYQRIRGKYMDLLAFFTQINPLIAKITRIMVVPFIYLLKTKYPDVDETHRGIFHSVTGVFIITLVWLIIMGLLTLVTMNNGSFTLLFMAFPVGLFVGGIIHLIEDSFTVSGIYWLQPFNQIHTKGKIKTMPEYIAKKREIELREREYILTWYFIGLTIIVIATLYFLKIILLTILLMFLGLIVAGKIWGVKISR